MADENAKIRARDVSPALSYGDKKAIGDGVDRHFARLCHRLHADPSGLRKSRPSCGASTAMNDTIAAARVTGLIELEGEDIHGDRMDVVQIARSGVGMVLPQKPKSPSPSRSTKNIAYGPKISRLGGEEGPILTWWSNARSCARRAVGGGQGPAR